MTDATTSSSANAGFVGIKFCQEWFVRTNCCVEHSPTCVFRSLSNNMLYPREDKENRILLYAVNVTFAIRR